MIGAIAGDMIGSRFEHIPQKNTEFELFTRNCRYTDDTVLTLATARAILNQRDYGTLYREFGKRFPGRGYGGNFNKWIAGTLGEPYRSWGNGSAMRVAPVAWAWENLDRVLEEAERSARPTHSHPEGVRGAKAIASAIFLSRKGFNRDEIQKFIQERVGYDLNFSLDQIRPDYRFDVSCQGSVPHAIRCFLDGDSWESGVRLAVSLGGDSDTIACMAGAIGEAYWGGVPAGVEEEVRKRLDPSLIAILDEFLHRFISPS